MAVIRQLYYSIYANKKFRLLFLKPAKQAAVMPDRLDLGIERFIAAILARRYILDKLVHRGGIHASRFDSPNLSAMNSMMAFGLIYGHNSELGIGLAFAVVQI